MRPVSIRYTDSAKLAVRIRSVSRRPRRISSSSVSLLTILEIAVVKVCMSDIVKLQRVGAMLAERARCARYFGWESGQHGREHAKPARYAGREELTELPQVRS